MDLDGRLGRNCVLRCANCMLMGPAGSGLDPDQTRTATQRQAGSRRSGQNNFIRGAASLVNRVNKVAKTTRSATPMALTMT